jgi:hypothetical protein
VPECIHGLEIPLCAICYPTAAPEKPRAARVSAPRAPRAAGVTAPRKSIDVAGQRVFHVTHIRNLEPILRAGGLQAAATPEVDLSTELTRELRRTVELSTGGSVADFVSFFLSPSASLWDDLRRGAEDETRWSPAARAAASADLVVLVTTVGALGEAAIVADGDAAGDETRRMLERLHGTEAALAAEVLVKDSLPFTAVQLIGVANDRVRDRVRDLTHAKVVVYPPWFQQPE